MESSIEEVEAVLRKRLCSVCSDQTADGDCGLADPGSCTLFQRLPSVAEAIVSVDSAKMEDYIHVIRERLCSTCPHQAADGSCEFRDQVPSSMVIAELLRPPARSVAAEGRALETSLSLLVEAINEANRVERRPSELGR